MCGLFSFQANQFADQFETWRTAQFSFCMLNLLGPDYYTA